MKKILLLLSIIFCLYSCSNETKKLPILGEKSTKDTLINGKNITDTVYQTIAPFRYYNQDSVLISNKDYDGSIYVADFFFTTCNSICPIMHRNLLQVYVKYKGDKRIKFLSHSIDAKYDLPSRLKRYADKLGITSPQWNLIHGSRDSIYDISAKNYLVAAYADNAAPQGLVHQGWFVLIDKEKRIRGAYDGTKMDQVEQLMKDIDLLLQEYEQK
ncbi:MAG: SCO family protein [Sphingobacteriaceae bacterium]